MPPSKTALLLAFLGAVTFWLLVTAVHIERLNTAAGSYLPRNDNDGKWRVSSQHTARDHLRGLVGTVGLGQYVLAPGAIILGVGLALRSQEGAVRSLVMGCCAIAFGCFGLAWYRGYWSSLGW